MRRYPKYKDSGIQLIGKIPNEWVISKLKNLSELRGRIGWRALSTEDYVDEGIILLGVRNISEKGKLILSNLTRIPKEKYDESPEIQIVNGDVLLAKTGATIGKSCVVKNINEEMTINAAVNIFRPKIGVDSFYLNYLITSYFVQFQFHMNTSENARGNLFQKEIQEISTPFSFSLVEQQQIVEFLDQKTSLVDSLIEKKLQKIELLKEQRTNIINQTITKGLNPNVKMKDSGVELIGEIPEHWEKKKITYCFQKIGSGTTPTSGQPQYYENGEYYWLQTGDLNDGEICETSKKITGTALKEFTTLRFYPIDSLVIAMYGATIGKLGILKIESTTNQACCVLSSPKGVDVRFVYYWFISNKNDIISLSYGGGQPNINQDIIRNLRLQIPLVDEQKHIVEYLDQKTNEIDTTITLENKKIDLLKEYRQILISEVVTGKIDIRKN